MFMEEVKDKTVYGEKPCVDAESTASVESAESTAEADESVKIEHEEAAETAEEDFSEKEAEDIDNGNSFETKELAALIEEAENRGYLRGRNEKIEELMSAPGMYCPQGLDEAGVPALPTTEILANMRRSV